MGTLTDLAANPDADARSQICRLLAHLEQKLGELDKLQHDIAVDAQALARAVTSPEISSWCGVSPCR